MKRHLPLLVESSIKSVQDLQSRIGSKFEGEVRTSKTVTCSKGCASCCYHPVMISLFEGILIYRWLSAHQLWTFSLKEKLRAVSDQQYGASYEVWLMSLIPCPLLNEKNECTAHKARPLVCRTFFATSDPYYCHPHRLGDETRILPREIPIGEFHSAEEGFLRKHGLQFLKMPIGAAILLGEEVSEGKLPLENVDQVLYETYVTKG